MQLYATDQYIEIHDSKSVLVTEDEHFRICLSLSEKNAFGFKYSPIGAFIRKTNADFESFKNFQQKLVSDLINKNINKLSLRQPPNYYPSVIPNEWLEWSGFNALYADFNQYIELGSYDSDQMHLMEKRKLIKSQQLGFQFIKEPMDHLPETYEFISLCRKAQGLQINIAFDKLKKLFETFPLKYSTFSLRLKGEIACAVITAQPLENIIYYYLPATLPKYKPNSPMVLLLKEMINYFQLEGINILDLGLSSIQGTKQKGLFDFKKRMGALSNESMFFEKQLT